MKEFLFSCFPPNFGICREVVPKIIETVHIAIISICLSIAFALPLSFLGAKNTSPSYAVYKATRLLFNLLRAVPTLLFALIFIAMVGLGPFPGVLGLSAHCIGSLGKYFSETIENIDPGVVDAAEATGANRIQVIMFAIIPELKPMIVGYCLYYLEYCLRTSTMLGIVGAGGIGMELLTHIRLFRYQEALMILIIIVSMVTVVDTISFSIRKKMIGLKAWR